MTDALIEDISRRGSKPTLMLHVCCAPCSSSVLEYLNAHFRITLYYYNPNITEQKEYDLRFRELERLVGQMPLQNGVTVIREEHEPAAFFGIAKGYESEPEGGERCTRCYRLRLEKTVQAAQNGGFDYFTTTLSVSPYKDAVRLNKIGEELSLKYGVPYLFSDFKKKNGYKRSVELSGIYGLYRQDYCGCSYSKAQAQIRRLEKIGK